MTQQVFITGRGILCPAGFNFKTTYTSLVMGQVSFARRHGVTVGILDARAEEMLGTLKANKNYRHFDRAVLLGILAAREATQQISSQDMSVIMGSSRGATESLEKAFEKFMTNDTVLPFTSPTTTAGSFAAAISRDLKCDGLSLSVSSACSTSLHAIGLGSLLISSGQSPAVVAGGSESALTPFTLEMLQAAKVYGENSEDCYPVRPLHTSRSGLVLGEGSAAVLMESHPKQQPLARISGYGFASEQSTLTGITETGDLVERVIQRTLENAGLRAEDVDLVVGHGASTRKGDLAEINGLKKAFPKRLPHLVFHKWCLGHLLGASGAASVALAVEHLQANERPAHPYWIGDDPYNLRASLSNLKLRHILILSLGFGGNAGALIVSKV